MATITIKGLTERGTVTGAEAIELDYNSASYYCLLSAVKAYVGSDTFTDTPVDYTADHTLTAGQSAGIYTNIGANAMVVFDLPAALEGYRYWIVRSAPHIVRIQPDGSELIGDGLAGKYLEMQGNNSMIKLRRFEDGKWAVENESGVNVFEV